MNTAKRNMAYRTTGLNPGRFSLPVAFAANDDVYGYTSVAGAGCAGVTHLYDASRSCSRQLCGIHSIPGDNGMRVEKIGERGTERYTYDDKAVLQQFGSDNQTIAKYEYGATKLISLNHSTEGKQFYFTDALNSVVNLTNSSGAVQARYQYDAWGLKRNESGSSWNRFAFTGYEEDKETNLLYAKARYYDPEAPRFLSQDAWEGEFNTPPSLHKYLYAYQNPTVYIDIDGNEPVSVYLAWSAVNAGVNTGIDYGFHKAFGREGEEFDLGTNYAANYGISVATGGVGAYFKHAPKAKRVAETAVEFSGEVAKEYNLRRDEGASLTQAAADTAISMTIGKAAADRIAKAAKPHLETVQESVGSLLQKAKDKTKIIIEKTDAIGGSKTLLALPPPDKATFNAGERLVSARAYESIQTSLEDTGKFTLGKPGVSSFFFNKAGDNPGQGSLSSAIHSGFDYKNLLSTINDGGNELVRIRFKLDKFNEIAVPGVSSSTKSGLGVGEIPGTNSLYTGTGKTKTLTGNEGIDEFIGKNIDLYQDDILDVKRLGDIKQ